MPIELYAGILCAVVTVVMLLALWWMTKYHPYE